MYGEGGEQLSTRTPPIEFGDGSPRPRCYYVVTVLAARPRANDLLWGALVVSSLVYALYPESALAPWLKPLPALAAAALVQAGSRPGSGAVVAGLLVAALGDVLVEFARTARLGTLAFAIAVVVMASGLARAPRRSIWYGLVLAGSWAGISGTLVVPALGDRLLAGLVVLGATSGFLVAAGRAATWTAVGATLIATNFTLFAVDLVVAPLPRWLVIGTYDAGLLLLAIGLSAERRPVPAVIEANPG
jgi:hypothetical protein